MAFEIMYKVSSGWLFLGLICELEPTKAQVATGGQDTRHELRMGSIQRTDSHSLVFSYDFLPGSR